MAGFDILYANEIQPAYAHTLQRNHPRTWVDISDIRTVHPSEVMARLGLDRGELELLAGGPPCQGFSVNAPLRSKDDPRNHLFLNFLRFVEATFPRAVLIENVPGIVSYQGGEVVDAILSSLSNLGYQSELRILYAAHYGVPQMRWRTVFLAFRDDTDPLDAFPPPTHYAKGRANFRKHYQGQELVLPDTEIRSLCTQNRTTVWDAISDLPPIPNKGGSPVSAYLGGPSSAFQADLRQGSQAVRNHQCTGLGPANLKRLPHIPPGGSWRDIPWDILPKGMQRARRSDHTQRYGRLHPDGLASTILTKCDPHWGAFIHPAQDRVLSVREAARLQSFPDWVEFTGSLQQQYEQVGNAVPPLMGAALGRQLKGLLLANDPLQPTVPTNGYKRAPVQSSLCI